MGKGNVHDRDVEHDDELDEGDDGQSGPPLAVLLIRCHTRDAKDLCGQEQS